MKDVVADRAPGHLRLHALPATDLWNARNTLTQRSIGPRSTPIDLLETSAMKDHDVAGLALFNRPYAWIGVERSKGKISLAQFDEQTDRTARGIQDLARVAARRLRLSDGAGTVLVFHRWQAVPRFGEPFTMVFQLATFQGVRYALFNYNAAGLAAARRISISMQLIRQRPQGHVRPIPFRERMQTPTFSACRGLAHQQ